VGWIVARAVISSTLVPIAEELAFRGYLLRRLVNREFDTVPWDQASVVAVVTSSLAFGLLHDSWLAGSAAGLIFAWVQVRTGSHANAIVAHGVANAGVAVWVVAGGAWHQWL
jgi:CAAX prenyl protease-like protein